MHTSFQAHNICTLLHHSIRKHTFPSRKYFPLIWHQKGLGYANAYRQTLTAAPKKLGLDRLTSCSGVRFPWGGVMARDKTGRESLNKVQSSGESDIRLRIRIRGASAYIWHPLIYDIRIHIRIHIRIRNMSSCSHPNPCMEDVDVVRTCNTKDAKNTLI